MTIMNQTYDTSGSYLERLMQEQHQHQHQHQHQQQHVTQQQLQQLHQFPGTGTTGAYTSSSGIDGVNTPGGMGMSGGSSGDDGFQCGSYSSSGGGGQIGAGGLFTHQQQQQENQNRMLALLKERQQQQQQQQFGNNSDLSSVRGFSNSNIGMDSRLGGGGVGSGSHPNAWMEGGGGYNNTGSTSNGVGSMYSNEQQDLLLNSQQRYNPHSSLQGDSIGGNNNNLSSFSNNGGGLNSHSHSMQQNNRATSLNNAHQEANNRKTFADMILAKQAQVAFLEAAQSQLPRTTRLPCGARGMKADHNSSTAFFDVPETARHGQHLLCSHSVCRAAGVKFRYCFFCRKPVTKQNFRSRHLHANLDLPNNNNNNNSSNSNKKQKKRNVTKLGSSSNNNKDSAGFGAERTGIGETNNQPDIIEKNTPVVSSEEECTGKPVTDDDDKSVPNTKNEEEVLCSSSRGGDDDLERPSKIRKMVLSTEI